jgi:NitT/TauT family transport system permease protein
MGAARAERPRMSGASPTHYRRWRGVVEPAIVFLLIALLWQKAVDVFGIKRYLLPPLTDVLL